MAMTPDDLAADALWAEAKETHDQLHSFGDPQPDCEFCVCEYCDGACAGVTDCQWSNLTKEN